MDVGMYRQSKHPLYNRWCSMLARCENPWNAGYPNYGGRGIVVCAEWHDFGRFVDALEAEIGPLPWPRASLDRINVDGNYEPGNVRWATARQQSLNRRPRGEYRPRRMTRHGVV